MEQALPILNSPLESYKNIIQTLLIGSNSINLNGASTTLRELIGSLATLMKALVEDELRRRFSKRGVSFKRKLTILIRSITIVRIRGSFK